MSLWFYVRKFFNTNHFTLILAATLLGFSLIKYGKFPKPRSTKGLLAAIIFLGAALRLAWLFFSPHTPQSGWNAEHMLENDIIQIHAIDLTRGRWFVDEQGVPMARRPIGYPLLLGLLYKFFGVHPWVYQVLNLVLFAVTAALICGIAELLFSPRVGRLAAFLFAVFPMSIYSIALITDEHLFLPLWYGGLFLLLKEIRGQKIPAALFWYGLVFGYAAMTRTHAVFMPFVVAFAYFRLRHSFRAAAAAFLIVLAVMQLVNLPWVIRNYKVWGVPVFYTATAGYVYRCFNASATPEGGGHIPLEGEPGYSRELDGAQKSGNSGLSHVLANREMKKWMRENPKEALLLGTKRLVVFMGWNRMGVWPLWFQFYEGSFDPRRPVPQKLKDFFEETAYAFYYVILFSFIFSIFYLVRRWKTFSPAQKTGLLTMGACFFFWFLEHMVIYPDRKYRFPLEPLMIASACVFFDHVIFYFRWENLRQGIQKVGSE